MRNGDCDMFFALWLDHVTAPLQQRKQIEIEVSVYFAIYPLLKNQVCRF
jgi:hypothetical protein